MPQNGRFVAIIFPFSALVVEEVSSHVKSSVLTILRKYSICFPSFRTFDVYHRDSVDNFKVFSIGYFQSLIFAQRHTLIQKLFGNSSEKRIMATEQKFLKPYNFNIFQYFEVFSK